jgi:hypothetical protein
MWEAFTLSAKFKTFIATSCCNNVSYAKKTEPKPPSPSFYFISINSMRTEWSKSSPKKIKNKIEKLTH